MYMHLLSIPSEVFEFHLYQKMDRKSLLILKKVCKFFFYSIPTLNKSSKNFWKITDSENWDLKKYVNKNKWHRYLSLTTKSQDNCEICSKTTHLVKCTSIPCILCVNCLNPYLITNFYLQVLKLPDSIFKNLSSMNGFVKMHLYYKSQNIKFYLKNEVKNVLIEFFNLDSNKYRTKKVESVIADVIESGVHETQFQQREAIRLELQRKKEEQIKQDLIHKRIKDKEDKKMFHEALSKEDEVQLRNTQYHDLITYSLNQEQRLVWRTNAYVPLHYFNNEDEITALTEVIKKFNRRRRLDNFDPEVWFKKLLKSKCSSRIA